jgi:hypothetical protein
VGSADDLGSGRLILVVRHRRQRPGLLLDQNLVTSLNQRFYPGWGYAYSAFVIFYLFGYANNHSSLHCQSLRLYLFTTQPILPSGPAHPELSSRFSNCDSIHYFRGKERASFRNLLAARMAQGSDHSNQIKMTTFVPFRFDSIAPEPAPLHFPALSSAIINSRYIFSTSKRFKLHL